MLNERFIYYFKEISKIPRPSHHCKRIADYLTEFAKKHTLEHYHDKFHNVIIIKPASPGKESFPAVMLQGHTDIVAESIDGCMHDFVTDPISLVFEGDTVRADGTTLGADNGFAVALMLAILEDNTLSTPRIECVFTSDEEVGMLGADKIDLSMCRGEYLINADSDAEGIFTCGCAGGARLDFSLPVIRDNTLANNPVKIKIHGLRGGHSGTEIGKGNLNAIKLMGELLPEGTRLISIEHDGKDNAIASSCTAIAEVSSDLNQRSEKLVEKYKPLENGFAIDISSASTRDEPITEKSSWEIISFLKNVPYGVYKMCEDTDRPLVHTSNNIGSIKTDKGKISGVISLRSMNEENLLSLGKIIAEICKNLGGYTTLRDRYPGWDFNKNSSLRTLMCMLWEEMYKKPPIVDVIHAGLECGVILEKLPQLDIVSMGADIHKIHTPEEKMNLSSAKRCIDFIAKILEEIK